MSIVLGGAPQTTTARDLITRALRLINVLARREVPAPSEAEDGLVILNDMLDSWSLERGLILQDRAQTFNLVPGQQDYTFGLTGNFNSARPTKIERATFRDGTPPNDTPIELYDTDQWSNIQVKSQTGRPIYLYANQNQNADFLTVSIWPVPDAAYPLTLYTWEAVSLIESLDATLAVPAGFRRAMRYNLALELAPEYGKEVDGVVVEIASSSRALIKSANLRNPLLGMDSALTRRGSTFNYVTGE